MKLQLAVPALLVVCACDTPPTTTENVKSETWVKVRAAPDATPLEGPARVLAGPGATSVVTPPFRATVLKIRVREGDVVAAGAPLVDVLMPELLDAAGRYEGAKTRLAAWTERAQMLSTLRGEGLARSVDVSEATARVAEARADAQAARGVLLSAGLRDGEGASVLNGAGTLALKALQGGVVTRLAATLGENREPAAGPLVFIAGGGAVRVEARVQRPVPDGAWSFVDGAGHATSLRLLSRAPTADARDGAYLAWFESEDASALVAGALGRVVLGEAAEPSTFLVAAAAIHRDPSGAFVTTRSGVARVLVAHCEGDDCQVRGEVKVGDDVALGPSR